MEKIKEKEKKIWEWNEEKREFKKKNMGFEPIRPDSN